MEMETQPSMEPITSMYAPSQTEAFERVFSMNRLRIYRFLLSSLRDADLADSLTQECFLKAYRNWHTFRGEAQVSTWLMRIAINLQRDYWRSRRMQFWRRTRENSLTMEDTLQCLPASDESPERRVAAKEQLQLVWKIVAGFPEKERTLFLLRVTADLKLAEIADASGLPLGTVKANLSRSLLKLRTALGEVM
jgi:RNA polymerase sigma-70 factor, ECF subfamily